MIRGKTIYRLHSPFVYAFAQGALKDKRSYYAFGAIEYRRKQLLKDRNPITGSDAGAGSRALGDHTPTMRAFTRAAAIPPRYGRLLFRTVQYFKPDNVIELGSGTGIGSLYLSAGLGGSFFTAEGNDFLADTARASLDDFPLELPDWTIFQENFDTALPKILSEIDSVGLAFVDGHHHKAPTLRYFEALLGKCGDHSVLIFDDIHWSGEMSAAWEEIKAHPRVRLTIDIHRMGFVFFGRQNREKEHFLLYY